MSQLWKEFKSICEEFLKHIPFKPCSTNLKQPWCIPAIKCICRKKQRQYNRARLSKDPKDWATYYRTKKLVQQECRKAYNKYASDLVDEKGNISKRLWSYIKCKRSDQIGVPSLVLMIMYIAIALQNLTSSTIILPQSLQKKTQLQYLH